MTRMKMYKSGKFWVSSAVTALGATSALLGGSSTQAHADVANDQQVAQATEQNKTAAAPSAADVQAQITAAMNTNPTNVQVDTATQTPVSAAEAMATANEKQTSTEGPAAVNVNQDVDSVQENQTETDAAPDNQADSSSDVTTTEEGSSDSVEQPSEQTVVDDKSNQAHVIEDTTSEVAAKVKEPTPEKNSKPDTSTGDKTLPGVKTETADKTVTPKQITPKTTTPKVADKVEKQVSSKKTNKTVATPKKEAKRATVLTATPKSVKATQYYNYSATQKANAEFLYRYFSARGWTRSAIAGMLGNMTVESYLLPDITEIGGGGGYGLVQWTPASKLINWTRANGLDYRTLTGQAARIQYEMTHGIQFYHHIQVV